MIQRERLITGLLTRAPMGPRNLNLRRLPGEEVVWRIRESQEKNYAHS